MKKINNKLLMVLATLLLILTPCTIYAENEPETTPDPGESTEVTKITLNKTSLTLEIGNTETLTTAYEPNSVPKPTITWTSSDELVVTVTNGTVKAIGTGTAKITATTENGKTSECNVTVKEKTIVVEKSTDALLKSLTISNGTLDRSFKSDTLKYNVTVSSTITSLSIKPVLNDSKAGYLISENKNLKNGSVVKIVVTAEDGKTQKIYTFTIQKDSVNLNLKSLKIKGYTLNETFNPEVLKYTATIPNMIEEITIQAAAEEANAIVSVTGASNLKIGKNTVVVTVKNAAGNKQTYEIIVTREEESEPEENNVTSNVTSSEKDKNSSLTTVATPKNNDVLKYIIVSLACLILLAIGGIGIYFFIKTSPKRLKKINNKLIQEESPIVEVKDESNIKEVMNDDLVQTIEFNQEHLKRKTLEEELNNIERELKDEDVL